MRDDYDRFENNPRPINFHHLVKLRNKLKTWETLEDGKFWKESKGEMEASIKKLEAMIQSHKEMMMTDKWLPKESKHAEPVAPVSSPSPASPGLQASPETNRPKETPKTLKETSKEVRPLLTITFRDQKAHQETKMGDTKPVAFENIKKQIEKNIKYQLKEFESKLIPTHDISIAKAYTQLGRFGKLLSKKSVPPEEMYLAYERARNACDFLSQKHSGLKFYSLDRVKKLLEVLEKAAPYFPPPPPSKLFKLK